MRALLLTLALATSATAEEVALELVLLADASGSITESEIAFQRQGYAEAITHPEVLGAIGGTMTGSIAVTYVEWAANQAVVADWAVISDEASAQAFADAILTPPRQASGRNAIGAALLAGAGMIEANAHDGFRRVIDFSGDSTGNFSGPGIEEARDLVVAQGVTINALPILCEDCATAQAGDLTEAYRARIIGGQGAFVEPAYGRADFAAAVRRKLVLEIAGGQPILIPPVLIPAQASRQDAPAPRYVNEAGQVIASPDGRYVAELVPGPEQNGVATLIPVIRHDEVEVFRGGIAHSTRHGVAILWEAEGAALWVLSADIGNARVAPDATGAWREETSGDLPEDIRRDLSL